MQKAALDRFLVEPMKRFIGNNTTSGIILFASAALAMALSNSPWAEEFHHLWEIKFTIGFGNALLSKTLHHWINDGLMAVFFFVVGLELKRELIAGELREPRKALLPLAAAAGGMVFPALIYLFLNRNGEAANGWGIPMATDIAFALGVLYLLGDRVPSSLKVFLTALAIADDLGAVLVIAIFYTDTINLLNLATGAVFMALLISGNLFGVRHTLFYAILGIGGLWLAFLMSGVHATIAAVLAAFTIPASVKLNEEEYQQHLGSLMTQFRQSPATGNRLISEEQLKILESISHVSHDALTPLQKLEHAMHPLVAFIIMPIFALSNAGVTLEGDVVGQLFSPIALGIFFGLLAGKTIGISGLVWLLKALRLVSLPDGMTMRHVLAVGLLAAIGFTMSLFIAGLAFTDASLVTQAKLGILAASLVASVGGYLILKAAVVVAN